MRAALGLMGATVRWRGVPFLRTQERESVSHRTVCTTYSVSAHYPRMQIPTLRISWIPASRRTGVSGETVVGGSETMHLCTAASCAVLLLKKRLNSNWSYPARTAT